MARSRSQDKAARQIYHLSHCIMRMRDRYQLEMDDTDYDNFCQAFRQNKVTGAHRTDKGFIEGWLKFKDKWVCMNYSPDSRMVTTIMPCPPMTVLKEMFEALPAPAAKTKSPTPDEHNEITRRIDAQAKKQAQHLFEQAMVSEKCPRWLRDKIFSDPATEGFAKAVVDTAILKYEQKQASIKGMDPIVKKADLGWYKNKMVEASKLIKEGKYIEAYCWLDAAAGFKSSFRPSEDLVLTQHLFNERLEAQRPAILEHFKQLRSGAPLPLINVFPEP